jgi:UDP-N-acetylglucosamine 2-epimerase (non-hydrolysing)
MILITYGTRPEYIKIKPLIDEMFKREIPFKTLSTGQHKDIAPNDGDFNLDFNDYGGNRLDSVMKNCLSIPDEVFDGIDYILVQGDTTSVVGLSLTALHRKIKLIHLEAGLRSFDTKNPFPEENNRKIVSTIADIHLCPTLQNMYNLWDENISPDKTYLVGNTVLDNLLPYKDECEYTNKVLVTMHRRENHNNMDEWFFHINELAKQNKDLEFIIPLHPNPNVQKHKQILTDVKIINPIDHDELIKLLVKCKIVITDSGGIQEECSFFNKKCLVCRKVTERPESVGLTSFMVDSPNNLIKIFNEHIKSYDLNIVSPYGDGYSSQKICDVLKGYIKNKL